MLPMMLSTSLQCVAINQVAHTYITLQCNESHMHASSQSNYYLAEFAKLHSIQGGIVAKLQYHSWLTLVAYITI